MTHSTGQMILLNHIRAANMAQRVASSKTIIAEAKAAEVRKMVAEHPDPLIADPAVELWLYEEEKRRAPMTDERKAEIRAQLDAVRLTVLEHDGLCMVDKIYTSPGHEPRCTCGAETRHQVARAELLATIPELLDAL